MKLALCVGKNNYRGSGALRGCVNDANDIAERLKWNGWHVELLLDGMATADNCKDVLEDFAKRAVTPHDRVYWSYSGHGTQVKDYNGDEENGFDEAIVLDRVWIDDDIFITLKKFKNDNLGVFFDSCFSGTATRGLLGNPNYIKSRFIQTDKIPDKAQRHHKFLHNGLVTWWHLSGCSDLEFSYDAVFNGRYNGACTYYMLQSLMPYMKQEKLLFEIRKNLPSPKYPQTPTLDGMYQDKYLLDGETTEGKINKPVRKNVLLEILKLIVSLFKK